MHDAGVVVAPEIFAGRKSSRPPRADGEGGYRASGYLAGTYNLDDFGGPTLAARETIARDPAMLDFMRREWTPVLLEVPTPTSTGNAEVPGLEARLSAARADVRIGQPSYGADSIEYRVRLDRPALLVENETYFPGWSLRIETGPRTGEEIPATRVNGVFRGWVLPAGDYSMEARFRPGGLRGLAAVTAAAWLIFVVLGAARFRRHLAKLRPARV
jgi:hypothetical protein